MRPFVMRLAIVLLALAVAGPVELLVAAPVRAADAETGVAAEPEIDADADARTVAITRALAYPGAVTLA